MAESMRDIKRRIKSVNSTKQITHAMELVASAKLRRTRQRADARRAYTSYIISSMHTIADAVKNPQNVYLKENDSNKDLYIVIAADKGLAGGFNSNLLKYALSEIGKSEAAAVMAIGSKCVEFFTRRKIEILGSYTGNSESPTLEFAQEVGRAATNLFKSGVVNNVYIIYNRFVSVISQKPTIVKLVPLTADELRTKEDEIDTMGMEMKSVSPAAPGEPHMLMTFEPDVDGLLDWLIPRYLINAIYGASLENSAGEQAARRLAMENATDNADEVIEALSLKYNRARQGAITQEITEIVGGAEAIS